MQPPGDSSPDTRTQSSAPEIYLQARSFEDSQQTLRMLSLVLVPSGGWLLRHRRPAPGVLQVVFEFERNAAMDIYVMLVALGLELNNNSHQMLTSYCQRTADLPSNSTIQVASCDLEVREFSEDTSSNEPLFIITANA
jgi:hypothetical protein